ncbi:MAG: cytochrome c oxidase subunit III [Candidatus Tectimicrobiota bacterium]|nr:MAG: cytochrome c oxidase subunit III [Candidatus Tectomicrobia bacterium]
MQREATHAVAPAVPVPAAKLGMWWFLASEIVTFGGIIVAYLVFRLAHPQWLEEAAHLSVPIATFNTLVLLTSSLTMVLAFAAVDRGDERRVATWLALTVALGLVFVLVKAYEWRHEIAAGRVPGESGFWGFYYGMTGLHALHVLGGVVVNACLLIAALRRRLEPIAHRVEMAGLYWHFVDIVWIFLFPLLYLSTH